LHITFKALCSFPFKTAHLRQANVLKDVYPKVQAVVTWKYDKII